MAVTAVEVTAAARAAPATMNAVFRLLLVLCRTV
jgi:hypothetical protein